MDKDFYTNLIYKSLESSLDHEEEQLLKDWIQGSDENRNDYELIVETWKLSEDYQPHIEVNIAEDYKKVQDQIASTPPKPVARKIPLRNLFRYAAAIVLLLASAGVLYTYLRPGPPGPIITLNATDIQQVTCSDQSIITVQAGSTLEYPERFGNADREVRLNGVAFFQVEKGSKPFIIHMAQGSIRVLGTAFNVNTKEPEGLSIRLQEGSVQFTSTNGKSEIISAGQALAYSTQNNNVAIFDMNSKNMDSWIENTLEFESTPLNMAILDLSAHFGVQVDIVSESIGDCPFTSTFEDADLSNILSTFQVIFQLDSIAQTSSSIRLFGGRCSN